MHNMHSTIQATLRRERLRKGLSQVALASLARCSINTVSLAERGGFLSDQMAKRFANVLGIEPQLLLVREDLTPPSERLEAVLACDEGAAPKLARKCERRSGRSGERGGTVDDPDDPT